MDYIIFFSFIRKMIFNCFSFGSHIESNFSFSICSFNRSFSIRFELRFSMNFCPGKWKIVHMENWFCANESVFNVSAEKTNSLVPEFRIDEFYIYVCAHLIWTLKETISLMISSQSTDWLEFLATFFPTHSFQSTMMIRRRRKKLLKKKLAISFLKWHDEGGWNTAL